MSNPLPIAVLIPTWNGWDDTRLCLESIARLDPAPSRVMIVDNGSSDGTPDRIASHWPNVELLVLESNEGFSRAVNRGLRILLESGPPEAVFLINNDVVLAPGVLGRVWEVLISDDGIAGVCPLITYVDPVDRVWYGGGSISLWRGYIGHRYLRAPVDRVPDGLVETDYLTGAAALLRTEALLTVGMLDELFPFYAEDADWSLRARQEGWRLCFDSGERVAHRVSASMGGQFSRRKLGAKVRMLALLFRRHARAWEWFTLLPGLLFLTIPQMAVGLLRRGGTR
ncbi:glycosyltransferase family 2 protein [Candidatus Zixiibacteriota bacterium]